MWPRSRSATRVEHIGGVRVVLQKSGTRPWGLDGHQFDHKTLICRRCDRSMETWWRNRNHCLTRCERLGRWLRGRR